MRYVQRNEAGEICGHFANPQTYAEEEMADDAPELVAFDQRMEALLSPASLADQIIENTSELAKLKAALGI